MSLKQQPEGTVWAVVCLAEDESELCIYALHATEKGARDNARLRDKIHKELRTPCWRHAVEPWTVVQP